MHSVIHLTKKLVEDIEIEEIDFDVYKEFNVDRENEDTVAYVNEEFGNAEGYPISIDHVIGILNSLKDKGATHVEMNYHCDHIGYEFSGYEIKNASPDEIEKEVKRKQEVFEAEKEKLIKDLEERIEKIKNKK